MAALSVVATGVAGVTAVPFTLCPPGTVASVVATGVAGTIVPLALLVSPAGTATGVGIGLAYAAYTDPPGFMDVIDLAATVSSNIASAVARGAANKAAAAAAYVCAKANEAIELTDKKPKHHNDDDDDDDEWIDLRPNKPTKTK